MVSIKTKEYSGKRDGNVQKSGGRNVSEYIALREMTWRDIKVGSF